MDAAAARPPSVAMRPPDRYGDIRSPRRRWLWVVVSCLVAAVGVAWVLWAGLRAAQREVRWSNVGYDVVDDTTVEVTFTVVKDPATTVACWVEALDSAFATVGLTTAEVGPSERRAVTTTVVVRTQQRAVTGVVDRCRAG